MNNHTESECSNPYRKKKCKIRHDWMGKVIRLKLCQKLKIDHSAKWYMHKPESEN